MDTASKSSTFVPLTRTSLFGVALTLVAACSTDAASPTPSKGDSGSNFDSGTPHDSGSNAPDGSAADSGSTEGGDGGPRFDVTTKSGVVRGKLEGKTRAFLGIPYAAPPTGPSRWKPPAPVAPWSSARDATTPAKKCPQIPPGQTTMDATSDEDCLTVNVWVPEPLPATPAPVMVWVHGGAFVFGSGADSFYDGAQLAAAGKVVVVTMNYRLGALGFLAHPALTAESSSHPTSGNYGFEDQQAALRWVKDNAAAFSGDAGNVTLFGESAGGYSVCAHLVAPDSQGLFHKAISESGVCTSPIIIGTRAFAQQNGEALASDMGCTDSSKVLECLRSKTPAEFLGAFASSPKPLPGGLFFNNYAAPPAGDAGADAGAFHGSQTWGPVVDGLVIPKAVVDVGPGFAKVPLVLGTNANEGTLFTTAVFNGVPVANDAEYMAALTRAFGASATDVAAQYPSASFPSANDALSEVAGDAFFVCPARRTARNAATAGSDVYLYSFAHIVEQPLIANLRAFHASELLFVFGLAGLASLKPDEQPLLDEMQGYWSRFARTGDPNGGGAPTWPKYATSSDKNLSLNLPSSSEETGHKKAKCDFWDTLYK